MKVVFAHDHRFSTIDGITYSESQFDSSLWDRYLSVFDTIEVIGRKDEKLDDMNTDTLIISSTENVGFHLLNNISSLRGQILYKNEAVKQITEVIRNADSLIARLPSEIGFIAIEQAEKLGKPWCVEVVGCAWDSLWNFGTLKSKLYAPILMFRTKNALKKSTHAIYVTKTFLQSRYPASSGALSVGCSDVSIPLPLDSVLENRKKRILNNNKGITLGIIGTLRTKYKGIQTIIKALPIIRKEYSDVIFRVLGEGDDTYWRSLAKKHGVYDIVKFDGTLSSQKEIFNWLDGIDIYTHPSLQDGLPRVVVEAMSRACPSIASTTAGIPELIDDEWLITPKNHKILALLVTKMIKNKTHQTHQAIINFEKSKDYSLPCLSSKKEGFYKSFIDYTIASKK